MCGRCGVRTHVELDDDDQVGGGGGHDGKEQGVVDGEEVKASNVLDSLQMSSIGSQFLKNINNAINKTIKSTLCSCSEEEFYNILKTFPSVFL